MLPCASPLSQFFFPSFPLPDPFKAPFFLSPYSRSNPFISDFFPASSPSPPSRASNAYSINLPPTLRNGFPTWTSQFPLFFYLFFPSRILPLRSLLSVFLLSTYAMILSQGALTCILGENLAELLFGSHVFRLDFFRSRAFFYV